MTEITEVSIPGIDATVIVDVFNPQLTQLISYCKYNLNSFLTNYLIDRKDITKFFLNFRNSIIKRYNHYFSSTKTRKSK